MKLEPTISGLSTCAGRILVGLAVAASGLIAGCSNKPPGCAAPETVQTLREVLASQVQLLHNSKDGVVAHYFETHKLGVEMVTTEGYDESAKRHDCQATLTISDSNGTAGIRYVVQAIEGQQGQFLVKTFGDSTQFVRAVWTYMEAFAEDENKRAREKATEEADAVRRARLMAPLVPANDGPASVAEPEAKPVAAQRASVEPPVAAAAPSAPTAVLPATPDMSRVSASTASPAVALPSTAVPSFNCTAKLSPTEQLICDTPALSKADAALGLAYAKAVSAAADPGVLKQRQRDWRKTRDACTDAGCVQASYATRTEELSR